MLAENMDIHKEFLVVILLYITASTWRCSTIAAEVKHTAAAENRAAITKFYLEPTSVKLNGKVTLHCLATHIGLQSFARIQKIMPGSEPPVVLLINGVPEPAIRNNKRYDSGIEHTTMQDKTNNVTMWMSISNAQLEDGGNYTCFVGDYKSAHNLTLNVLAEPQRVELTVDGERIQANQRKEYAAGPHVVECKAINSNPEASVTIKYDNKVQSHQLEVVDNVVVSPPDNTEYSFLRKMYHNTTATLKNFLFDMAQARQLTCEAKVDSATQAKAISFIPSIKEAPPRFKCDDYVYIRPSMDKVTINCTVFASPDMKSTKFRWTSISDNNHTINIEGTPLISHSDNDMYKYVAEVKQHHENKWQFSMLLTFTDITYDVNKMMVNSTYFFVAENKKGPTPHEVMLLQDPKSMEVSGASVLTTCVLNSIGLAIIIQVYISL